MVSASAVRRHLRYLLDVAGVGLSSVARSADVDPAIVYRIHWGKQRSIHHEKAERLLAVGSSSSTYVDGAETWHRIRELQALGVKLYEIGEVISGYRPRTADPATWKKRWPGPARRPFTLNRRGAILRRNAEAVERFYVDYHHRILRRATPEESRADHGAAAYARKYRKSRARREDVA